MTEELACHRKRRKTCGAVPLHATTSGAITGLVPACVPFLWYNGYGASLKSAMTAALGNMRSGAELLSRELRGLLFSSTLGIYATQCTWVNSI